MKVVTTDHVKMKKKNDDGKTLSFLLLDILRDKLEQIFHNYLLSQQFVSVEINEDNLKITRIVFSSVYK